MDSVKVKILATTDESWRSKKDGRITQFERGAFDDCIRRMAAYTLRLLINHKAEYPVPLADLCYWLNTDRGLQCTTRIDTTTSWGRATWLSIVHRHIPFASVAYIPVHWRTIRLENGELLRLITRADLIELSLTSTPMLTGTSIEVVGQPKRPIAGLPDNYDDAELLAAFLDLVGLPVPPLPRRPRATPVVQKTVPKPAVKSKPFLLADEQLQHLYTNPDGSHRWVSYAELQRLRKDESQSRQSAAKTNSRLGQAGIRTLRQWPGVLNYV